jgi:hypothetical protein
LDLNGDFVSQRDNFKEDRFNGLIGEIGPTVLATLVLQAISACTVVPLPAKAFLEGDELKDRRKLALLGWATAAPHGDSGKNI